MAQEIEFDDEELRKFIESVISKTKNLEKQKEIVGAISAIVFRDVMQHFADEQGPNGKWKAWSKIYADHMKQIGRGGNKLLQWSGRLRQTFQPTKYKIQPHAVTWFNNAKTKAGFPYAFAHDTGEGVPERSFMWLSNQSMETITKIVLDKILEEANGS